MAFPNKKNMANSKNTSCLGILEGKHKLKIITIQQL